MQPLNRRVNHLVARLSVIAEYIDEEEMNPIYNLVEISRVIRKHVALCVHYFVITNRLNVRSGFKAAVCLVQLLVR